MIFSEEQLKNIAGLAESYTKNVIEPSLNEDGVPVTQHTLAAYRAGFIHGIGATEKGVAQEIMLIVMNVIKNKWFFELSTDAQRAYLYPITNKNKGRG